MYALVFGYAGMLLYSVVLRSRPFLEVMHFLAFVTIFIGIVTVLPFKSRRIYDINVTATHVEGPREAGPSRSRRSILLSDLNLQESKMPTFFKNGYLISCFGAKIVLYFTYFSHNQGQQIFQEIRTRLEAPDCSAPHRDRPEEGNAPLNL